MDSESILEKLTQVLCYELKLKLFGQHSIFKNEDNKTGRLEFEKPEDCIGLNKVEKIVKEFYKNEGYKVSQAYKNGVIEARNKKENYDIIITNCENYTISVNKSSA